MKTLRDLEKSAALQILDYLYENKESMRSQIEDNVRGSSTTIGSSLVILGEMGLLEERRVPPFTRYISLSPLGKQVAHHINEVKNLLKEYAV